MTIDNILEYFEENKSKKNIEGMKRFGITSTKVYGISKPLMKELAKDIKKDHELALKLWSTGIHDARVLCAFIEDPKKMTNEQIDTWVYDCDNWEVTDQISMKLIAKTKFARDKIFELSEAKEEFVIRAAFATMAGVALKSFKADDDFYSDFFPLIKKSSTNEQHYVKKAVNWALRQIGKRNLNLKQKAIVLAGEILSCYPNSKSAKWIANDALRELTRNKND